MAGTCFNCFKPLAGPGPCPHCGYDAAADAGKYPFALRPGSILNGRYVLGRVLGQGGFGITYIAHDDPTGRRVAIKEYYPSGLVGRSEDTVSVQLASTEQAEGSTAPLRKTAPPTSSWSIWRASPWAAT